MAGGAFVLVLSGRGGAGRVVGLGGVLAACLATIALPTKGCPATSIWATDTGMPGGDPLNTTPATAFPAGNQPGF